MKKALGKKIDLRFRDAKLDDALNAFEENSRSEELVRIQDDALAIVAAKDNFIGTRNFTVCGMNPKRILGWAAIFYEVPSLLVLPFFFTQTWEPDPCAPSDFVLANSQVAFLDFIDMNLVRKLVFWLLSLSVLSIYTITQLSIRRGILLSGFLEKCQFWGSQLFFDVLFVFVVFQGSSMLSCRKYVRVLAGKSNATVWRLESQVCNASALNLESSVRLQAINDTICWQGEHIAYAAAGFLLFVIVFVSAMEHVIEEKNARNPSFRYIERFNLLQFSLKALTIAVVTMFRENPKSCFTVLLLSFVALLACNMVMQPCKGQGRSVNNFRTFTYSFSAAAAICAIVKTALPNLDSNSIIIYGLIGCGVPVSLLLVAWSHKLGERYTIPTKMSISDLLDSHRLYLKQVGSVAAIHMAKSTRLHGEIAKSKKFIASLKMLVMDDMADGIVRVYCACAIVALATRMIRSRRVRERMAKSGDAHSAVTEMKSSGVPEDLYIVFATEELSQVNPADATEESVQLLSDIIFDEARQCFLETRLMAVICLTERFYAVQKWHEEAFSDNSDGNDDTPVSKSFQSIPFVKDVSAGHSGLSITNRVRSQYACLALAETMRITLEVNRYDMASDTDRRVSSSLKRIDNLLKTLGTHTGYGYHVFFETDMLSILQTLSDDFPSFMQELVLDVYKSLWQNSITSTVKQMRRGSAENANGRRKSSAWGNAIAQRRASFSSDTPTEDARVSLSYSRVRRLSISITPKRQAEDKGSMKNILNTFKKLAQCHLACSEPVLFGRGFQH